MSEWMFNLLLDLTNGCFIHVTICVFCLPLRDDGVCVKKNFPVKLCSIKALKDSIVLHIHVHEQYAHVFNFKTQPFPCLMCIWHMVQAHIFY